MALLYTHILCLVLAAATTNAVSSDLALELQEMKTRMDSMERMVLHLQRENGQLISRLGKCDEKFDEMQQKLNSHERLLNQLAENGNSNPKSKVHNPDLLGDRKYPSTVRSSKDKRSDDLALEPVVTQLAQKVETITADLQTLKNAAALQPHGSTYIRWGNAACPAGSAEIVYSGEMGGGFYNDSGAQVNHLCLPDNPVFDIHNPTQFNAGLWGAEYQSNPEAIFNMNPSCAVCHTARASTLMIPGTNACTSGWHLEYSGYLMSGHQIHHAATEYVCVDSSLGYRPNSQSRDLGALLYYVQAHCGSLSCPPYIENKLVLCAVCSK